MTDIEQAAQAIVDRLTAAGIRATFDARDANPPCVLLRSPTISYRFGTCHDMSWTAWIIVPDSGRSQVMKTFGTLLDQVQAALEYAAVSATPDDAVMPDGSTLPIYALTWSERIK